MPSDDRGAVRWSRLSLGLLIAAALAFVLALVDRPGANPWPLAPITVLRALVGLPVLLLVPGVALARAVFGEELNARDGGEPSLVWTLTSGAALALPIAVVHLIAIRALGVAATGPVLSGVLLVEAAVIAWRARGDATFALPPRSVRRAWLLGLVGLAIAVVAYGRVMVIDSTLQIDYFGFDALMERWPQERAPDLAVTRDHPEAVRFHADGPVTVQLTNRGAETAVAPVLFFVHGPRGFTLELAVGDRPPVRVAKAPEAMNWWNAPLGVLTIGDAVDLAPGTEVAATLTATLPDGASGPLTVLDLTGHAAPEVYRRVSGEGVYTGSLMTIAEFEALARELVHPRGHPEWSLVGRDLGIPPGYVHLATVVREVAAPHTATMSLFLLLQMATLLALALRALTELHGPLDPLVGLGLGAVVLQHMHAVHDAVQWNFADNWYTVTMCAALLALATRRPRLFATWALVGLGTRYPGAVVAGAPAALFFLLDREDRPWTRSGLMWLGFGVVGLAGLLILLGLVTGETSRWLGMINHEIYAEHFDQNPHVPLGDRLREFFAKWACYGGLGLVFLAPLRPKVSRLLMAAVAIYTPMLMLIDHFANHYILPLMAMSGIAVAANLAVIRNVALRRALLVLWTVVVAALAHPLVWGRVWEALSTGG